MSDWNIIVLSLFTATYLPLFWFVGMRIASEDILRKSKFYEVDPNVLVPGWAKTCTTVFCVLHYCLFIIPLTMIDWLHGLAAFGAGILLLVFKAHAVRVHRGDPSTGRLLIRVLKA